MNVTSAYAGEKLGQVRHGSGVYRFKNAFFEYEGDWRNGVMNGHGKLLFADGGCYEGDFVDGEIEGHGLRTWPDGSSYSGQFLRGERHGLGRHELYANGKQEVYEGQWDHNLLHGNGIYENLDVGDRYEGEFVKHKFDGRGTLESGNGDVYEGSWEQGRRSGLGFQRWNGKGTYEGSWEDGKRSGGEGSFFHQPSGLRVVGAWTDDRPVQSPSTFELHNVDELIASSEGPPGTPLEDTRAGSKAKLDRASKTQGKTPIEPDVPEMSEEEKARQRRLQPSLVLKAGTDASPELIVALVDADGLPVTGESGRTLRLSFYARLEKKEKKGAKAADEDNETEELMQLPFACLAQEEKPTYEAKPFGRATEMAESLGGVATAETAAEIASSEPQTARKGTKVKGKDGGKAAPTPTESDAWRWKVGGRVVDKTFPPRRCVFGSSVDGEAIFSDLTFSQPLTAGSYALLVEDISGPFEDEVVSPNTSFPLPTYPVSHVADCLCVSSACSADQHHC